MKVLALLIASALTIVAVAGCGDDDAGTPEDAMQSYLDALADGDAEAACDLLGPQAADTSLAQPDCDASEPTVPEEAQAFGESGEVEEVSEEGDEATVDVTAEGSDAPLTVDLVKEGDEWKVDGLAIADIEI